MSVVEKATDPGKNLPREQAKAARLSEWKRPETEKDREMARDKRIADWRTAYGDIDLPNIRTVK